MVETGPDKPGCCSVSEGESEVVYNSVFDAVKSQSILTKESGSV